MHNKSKRSLEIQMLDMQKSEWVAFNFLEKDQVINTMVSGSCYNWDEPFSKASQQDQLKEPPGLILPSGLTFILEWLSSL